MAESSFSCSISQGFNFEKDNQSAVGHLNYLKIGDEEIAADIKVTDPESISGDEINVVGVVSGFYWQGGYADPLQFSCQISTANKTLLATMIHTTLSKTNVELSFTIYDYDPEKLQYYKCCHTNDTNLNALINKSGGELEIDMGTDQNEEVVSPKNFTFNLGCMPVDEDMDIHLAFSVDGKIVKKWGVAVSS